ncbi:ABC transporter substrate-binding protein [Nonomuraea sp. K274]|uniref:ABC transporter substrate-binding protein n=1 Tax=Nonomuraea cypriaca TaxID=1187855 RepID=A0A931A3V5_9ACTN|nr:ABC transporter substrate-binding protein [Nonomuraea cypriaca]MBF8184618.1 ABC transporter substrate-binding protein [Nonomuraea cypriaca]
MTQHPLTRRNLLRGGGGLLLLATAGGCSFFDTSPDTGAGAAQAAGSSAKEAPALAELVKAGKLPPLEQRLPKNPLVVTPLREPGRYGGTWNSAMVGEDDIDWLIYTLGYEPLVRLKPGTNGQKGPDDITPNVAEFEVKDDGREYVFRLREGLKWSDGQPCTADDLMFAFEDVTTYRDLHSTGIYDLFLENGTTELVKVEKVDERTVRYVYKEPKAGLLFQIATATFERPGASGLLLPKHYLKQFHKKYNPDVDKLAKDQQLEDWTQLFMLKNDVPHNADMPTLHPWKITTAIGSGTAVVAERNPYYWKVDQQGRQLPYIDRFRSELVSDVEVELLKIMNGEIDMQLRKFNSPENKPLVAQNAAKGKYRLYDVPSRLSNTMIIQFNQTIADDGLRELFRNKDLRIGLSYAINRKEIIDGVYAGQGEPWQAAPSKANALYDAEFAKQYAEYDVAKANEHLDKAGLTEKDGDGQRLGPDGKPLSITIMASTEFPHHVEALEFVKKGWEAVGVGLRVDPIAPTLFTERSMGNNPQASTFTCSDFDVITGTGGSHYYVPSNSGSARYAIRWAQWYGSKGKSGDEPPEQVREQLEAFTRMRNEPDFAKALEHAEEVVRIAKEQFYAIGISSFPNEYGIVSNSFKNVPDSMAAAIVNPGPTMPEQYSL